MSKLVSAPLYFVKSGVVDQTVNLLNGAGYEGNYWSSTPNSNVASAYDLTFSSTSSINASYSATRRYGISVRCIAR